MRKYVVSFLAGILIASVMPVYGAVSSLVGQKVRAENTVIVNGKKLEAKSVNINGYTYSPNRAIADALGLEIQFQNGTIIFSNKELNSESAGGVVNETSVEESLIDAKIAEIKASIVRMQTEGFLITQQAGVDPTKKEEANKKIDAMKIEYQILKDELQSLEAQKAELEAQATPTP